jgi:polyhydroxyalkanoate synthase
MYVNLGLSKSDRLQESHYSVRNGYAEQLCASRVACLPECSLQVHWVGAMSETDDLSTADEAEGAMSETDAVSAADAAEGALSAPNLAIGSPETLALGMVDLARAALRGSRKAPRQAIKLVSDLLSVDTSAIAKDRRFAHPAWRDRAALQILASRYLDLRSMILDLAEQPGFDPTAQERARIAASFVAEGLAPTNILLLNPAGWDKVRETYGKSMLHGASNLVGDVLHNGALPSLSRRDAHTLGSDMAATPGRVIHRSELCELIQYEPQQNRVRATPLLMVPSPVNKFYLLDLAPGRSLVEAALRKGLQVFTLSWANPSGKQRHWGLDAYVAAAEEAALAACDVTRTSTINLLGVCAGGQITAGLNTVLAARRTLTVAASTFLVSGIDTSWPTTFASLSKPGTEDRISRRVQKKGIVPGRDISRTFASLRPQQLIWGPWVNNYVLGNDPPSTDILFWNADLTNLPAAFHAEQAQMLAENPFAAPDGMRVLGQPVDLSQLTADHYYLAARDDHIVPWQACYRSAQLLGNGARFVVASGGHIQGLVCPPNNKASYRSGEMEPSMEQETWRKASERHVGSWWEDWLEWVLSRSGRTRTAPTSMGSSQYPAGTSAPGDYVYQNA